MAAFLEDNRAAVTEAEKGGTQSKITLDAVFSTLPELEELAGERFESACVPSTNCEAANEATCKEDVKLREAEASATDSPRLVCVDREPEPRHLASRCNDMASSPQIPSELQENLTLGATDAPLPPMVDSVTNNMFNVSIHHGGQFHENGDGCLENRECVHPEHHEKNVLTQANDEGDAPMGKTDADDKPCPGNGHAARVNTDGLSLQMNDCKMGDQRVADGKPPILAKNGSEHNSDKCNADDDDDDKDDADGDKEEEAEDSDINDDEEVDDSEEAHDSDSSSSTSSLSFSSSSSSDDDIDEVIVYRLPLNGASNQKDFEMEVESECEEGELKESPSQRKKSGSKKEAINESSEDEGGLKKPVRSKNETKLPYVPKVSVTLEPHHTMVPVGIVSSVVGVSLIVEGIEGQQPLTEGSILWLTDQRLPLGIVDELFGPVKKPFYVVRYNDAMEMPEGAREGAQVSYVRDFADFVLSKPDLYTKGYDQSADNDEEISDSEVYFSDDEKEAEYNRSKSRMKRGSSETSIPDTDNRRHQDKGRAPGKRFNKDNQNWRSRGENARNFQSNNEDFSGRPPRHQNPRFQHHRGDREPPFRTRGGPVPSFNERAEHRLGNQSPIHQVQSQQSLDVDQSKSPPTPARQAGVGPSKSRTPSHESQSVHMNQKHSSTHSTSQDTQVPLQINQQQSFTTSQQTLPPQMNQPHTFMQSHSQHVQPLPLHQPHNLMQPAPLHVQMNQPQSTFPQVQQPWQMNQPHNSAPMASPPQLPGMQHSQTPMYNHAVVVGQIPQAAVSGYGIPMASNAPLQSGMDTAQGLLPMYQSPVYQQVPSMNQFPSASPHQFSGQASQVPQNMGMPMSNQVQAVHADGYPMGVQSAAFGAPVLGIPAGQASTPFNYPSQVVYNQNFSGFTPGGTPAFVNQGLPPTFGVPEQARNMQQPLAGVSAGSWQPQHSPQDSSGPRQQQPYHERPPFSDQRKGGPYRGRRF